MTDAVVANGRQIPRDIDRHFANYAVGQDHIGDPFRVSQDEINAFTRLFADKNPIHTAESVLSVAVVPALMLAPLITKYSAVPPPYKIGDRPLMIKEISKIEFRKPLFADVDEARVKCRLLEAPRATALGVMVPIAFSIVVEGKDIVRGALTLVYVELRD